MQSGLVEDQTLLKMFLSIAAQKRSGTLVAQVEAQKKSIMFVEGQWVGSKSNIAEESLLQVLLEEKVTTAVVLKPLVQTLQGKEPLEQISVLMAQGVLSGEQAQHILEKQSLKRLANVLKWTSGKYAFVDERPMQVIPLGKKFLRGLWEAVLFNAREHPNLSQVKQGKVKKHQEGLIHSELTEQELQLWNAIGQEISVEKLCEKIHWDLSRTAQTVLALLAFESVGVDFRVATDKERDVSEVLSSSSIEKKYQEVLKQNFYEALGVEANASVDKVKKAYFVLAKEYHPDRMKSGGGEVDKKKLEKIFATLSEAQATLSQTHLRAEYDAKLATNLSPESLQIQLNAEKILDSEMLFQKGLALVRKGQFEAAVVELKQAIALYSGEPEYTLLLGWAMVREGLRIQSPKDMMTGKGLIEEALKKNEKLHVGYYYLGIIEKNAGNLGAAKKHFEKTLQGMPHHAEAASELRLMQHREQKSTSKVSLGGIFGKKKQ